VPAFIRLGGGRLAIMMITPHKPTSNYSKLINLNRQLKQDKHLILH